MSDLLKRLGWTTSLALCAALIGAGCDNQADDEPVIETVEPSPPEVPSTDMGDVQPADEYGAPEATPPTPADEATTPDDDIATGSGVETATPEPDDDRPTDELPDDTGTEPEIQDEPAEPGIDEEPQGDDDTN